MTGASGIRRIDAHGKTPNPQHRLQAPSRAGGPQEYLAGETLHGLARRHELSRTLIRIWVDKYEAGAFDEDAEAASTIQEYEARIAALERLVGKQALELEFLKGAQRQGRRPKGAPMSVVTGPKASPSLKDAG